MMTDHTSGFFAKDNFLSFSMVLGATLRKCVLGVVYLEGSQEQFYECWFGLAAMRIPTINLREPFGNPLQLSRIL